MTDISSTFNGIKEPLKDERGENQMSSVIMDASNSNLPAQYFISSLKFKKCICGECRVEKSTDQKCKNSPFQRMQIIAILMFPKMNAVGISSDAIVTRSLQF